MPPLLTKASLSLLLIRPSGECSRTGRTLHSLIARRTEFGVAKSRFGRCSPKARLKMPNTSKLTHTCAPASSPVLSSWLRSVAADFPEKRDRVVRLFWSHPDQMPRLRSLRRI